MRECLHEMRLDRRTRCCRCHSGCSLADALRSQADETFAGRVETIGTDMWADVVRNVLVTTLDARWRDHLDDVTVVHDSTEFRQLAP